MALVEQVKTAPAGTDTGVEGKDIPRGYVEMTFVKETATGRGRNELFIMEDMKNGTVKLTEGRVGITVGRYKPRVSYRPAATGTESIYPRFPGVTWRPRQRRWTK